MVSLHYTITKDDYVNFYTHVMWDAADRKRSRMKSILKQVGFVGVFMGIYWFVGGFRFMNNISVIIILLMFATSLLPLMTGRSGIRRNAEDIADDPENASVFTDNYLTASDAGMHIKTAVSDNNYSWKAIVRKTETSSYYFLFLNAIHAIIIPKKVFGSMEALSEFNKLLSKNLSLEAEIKDAIINAGE
ncbi:MAG: YcxB family protein [Ferruginibacter sp.]